VRILVEPKNALIKQYERVFELDGVKLEFSDDALEAVAEQALLRVPVPGACAPSWKRCSSTSMYDPAERTDVGKCVIDRSVVLDRVNPTLVPPRRPPGEVQPEPPAAS